MSKRIPSALLFGILFLCGSGIAIPEVADAEPLRFAQRGQLENAMRGESPTLYASRRAQIDPDDDGLLSGDKLDRIKHGAFSLLVPGWSQWRSGHDGRALLFATAEVAVWGTFLFSELQADYREDQYVDFAEQFARVDGGGHDDDYWRAVASHRSSRDFNDGVRAEIRAGLTPEDALIGDEDSWQWQSEQRFREFQQLRADALSAQDRADFVLVFALVNRLVAFVDAVRSGPPTAEETELAGREPAGWSLDFRPDPVDPSASLSWGGSF